MQPKYTLGQLVWCAGTRSGHRHEQCPDCLGKKKWVATLPTGEQMLIPCPTCNGDGVFSLYAYDPDVTQRTIGSVRMDTAARDGEQFSYMCEETGIGTGTIYYEPRLHETEQYARTVAERLATEANERMATQFIDELIRRRKSNRAGSIVGYLRGKRSDLQKQVNSVTRHIDSLTKG